MSKAKAGHGGAMPIMVKQWQGRTWFRMAMAERGSAVMSKAKARQSKSEFGDDKY